MGEMLAFSQSSLFLLPKYRLHSSIQGLNSHTHYLLPPSAASSVHFITTKPISPSKFRMQKQHFPWGIKASVISDSKVPTTFTVDSAGERVDILLDTGGGDGDGDGFGGKSGRGGGGGGNNGGDNHSIGDEGSPGESRDQNMGSIKKKMGLSMSQKLTLGYAVLVGAGGVMGYLRSGSRKSLVAGGLSASLLYYVFTLLPRKPVFASSLGFGLSAALLGVMCSRFRKSGKIFPAGIISLVSLIMSGGYLHGIMRSVH